MRTTMVIVAVGLFGVGVAGVAPAGAAPAQKGVTEKITVGDNYFKPDEIQITAGTKVKWTNKGKILHNVQPEKGKKWGTKSLTKGDSYSYRFKKPGRYAYYCSFHGTPNSGQHGVIEVVAPDPVTTTTSSVPGT